MAHVTLGEIVPSFTDWEHFASGGTWLKNFVVLLSCLPSKNHEFSHTENNAFISLWDKALRFINDDFYVSTDQSTTWGDLVEAANNWEANPFNTLKEFSAFVSKGRKGAMTYTQVCQCLKDNKTPLFWLSPWGEDKTLNHYLSYLKDLRELRSQVRRVMSFINMPSSFEITWWYDKKTYKINPRKLYEEFKSHYAYETALCIPMY